jgi:uncharacterized protein (TIGR03083 family)
MTDASLNDMPRDEFLARIHVSWAQWLAAIDNLTDLQVQAPGTCGEWSVKDLIGHVAVWDSVAIDKVQGILAGADRPDVVETTDAFNSRTTEALREEPLDEMRESMGLVHSRLMRVLEDMADVSDEQFLWINRVISEDTWQHYDEHRQQVIEAFPTGQA